MNLHRLWPAPWPVEIRGKVYDVSEYRLRDLSCLGDWVARRRGDALAALPPDSLRAEDPRAWRRALLAAYRLADGDSPEWGDPDAADLVGSPEGVAFACWVALRRHQPAVDLDTATRLTAAMLLEEGGLAEWVALQRAALRPDVKQVVNRIVLSEVAPERLRRPRREDWPVAVAELVLESGMTLDAIGDLTCYQFNVIASRGKPPDGCSIEVGPDSPLPGRIARWWAMEDGANGDGHA